MLLLFFKKDTAGATTEKQVAPIKIIPCFQALLHEEITADALVNKQSGGGARPCVKPVSRVTTKEMLLQINYYEESRLQENTLKLA